MEKEGEIPETVFEKTETEHAQNTISQKSTSRRRTGEHLAQIYSVVFHPFLMPLYGVIVLLYGPTYLSILPNKLKMHLIIAFALTTLLFPAFTIALLKSLKIIPDLSLSSRRERVLPLLIVAIGYMTCFYLTSNYVILGILPQLLSGALAVVLICFAINLFWKISLHMAAMGGCVAILFYITLCGYGAMGAILLITLLLAGFLGTARLYLGKHNAWQILAGFCAGAGAMGLVLLWF